MDMVSYFNKGVVFEEEVRRSLSLDLLDLEAGGQGLLQLLGLLLVLDHQGVEEPRASDLELVMESCRLMKKTVRG